MNGPAPETCLAATEHIDSDSRVVRESLQRLDINDLDEVERASRLFNFVRDEIDYEFTVRLKPDDYVASQILSDGRGFCVRKAIALCALGRAAGIPSALAYSDLLDHTLPESVVQAMGTNCIHHHGLAAFFLDGRWVKFDASIPSRYAAKRGLRSVEFDGQQDALQAPLTRDGDAHVEYVCWHGLFNDFDFPKLMSNLAAGFAQADAARLSEMGLRTPEEFLRAAENFKGHDSSNIPID